MNHKAPGDQGRETWPVPENNESKRPKRRRKSKSGSKKNGHANLAAHNESAPNLENGSSREYSADDLSEAVIWVRDYNPDDTSVKPLINTEQYLASKKESKNPNSVVKSGNNKIPLKKMSNKNSVSQKIEHFDVQMPPADFSARDTQLAEHEQAEIRERKYFWNQGDVYHTNDRDVLPEISAPKSQDGVIVEQEASPGFPFSPSLAEAINPNDPSFSGTNPQEYQDNTAAKPRKNQKSSFIARRREKRAVQSQQMEGETFDRITPASPYNELVPEAAPAFEDASGALGQPEAMDDAAAGHEEGPEVSSSKYPETPVASHQEEIDNTYAEHKPESASVELALEKSEQLDLARSIHIDGVSVYEMFTAGRIDDAGLRRIIVEFLRGGDLRDVIKSEIIRQQLKFERDPQLRDTPVNKKSVAAKAGSKVKGKTKSLIDAGRNRDRTEKLAEFTQSAIEKSHEFLDGNPKTGQMMGIVAIVIIYLAILIVAIAK